MADITGLGSVADLATTVIEKIWPDKSKEEQAQLAAALAIVQGQLDVNKAEAGSGSLFTSGWRPAVGWVCAAALAYQFLLCPILLWVVLSLGHAPIKPPVLDDTLWQLMFGMLGLGGLRSFDKLKGTSR